MITAVKPNPGSGVGPEASDALSLMDASHLELERNQSDLSWSDTDSAGSIIVEHFEAARISADVQLSTEECDGEHAKECPAPPSDEAPAISSNESSPKKSATHGPIVSIRHHSLSPLKSIRHTKTLSISNQDAGPQEENPGSSPDKKEHATRRPTILWQDAIKVADMVEKSHKSAHSSGHSRSHSSATDPESSPGKLERPRSASNSPGKIVKSRDASEVTTLSTHYFSMSLAAATVCTMATMAVYALRKPH